MKITKAIVSSSHLLRKLQELKAQEEYMVSFSKARKEIHIDTVTMQCECSNDCVYKIAFNRISRLIEVLLLLEDQPITIAIDDDGWLYIKEAIL